MSVYDYTVRAQNGSDVSLADSMDKVSAAVKAAL